MTDVVKQSDDRCLGVLGIGLVMEEVGNGARLVFRYPSCPAPIFFDQKSAEPSASSSASPRHRSQSVTPNSSPSKKGGVRLSTTGNSSDPAIRDSNSIDLFFDLPARILSKLFRPKRALCHQPLTLNVSGTTFCCRAELFDSQPSTVGGGEGSNHPLVLFSVIVALAPLAASHCAAAADASAIRFDKVASPLSNNANNNTTSQNRSDLAFSAIGRVHDNLARLCRVLKREELRCRYVSRQCNMLLRLRKDYEAREGPDNGIRAEEGAGSGMDGNISKKGNTASASASGSNAPPSPSSPKDKRSIVPPPPSASAKVKESSNHDETRPKMTQRERREYIQNLIEIMLAATCQQSTQRAEDDDNDSDDEYKQQLYGNLGRELAQVFHCLSNDSTTTNQSSLLGSIGDGKVYINRHVSVPIAPLVDGESSLEKNESEVHPYHTLLFPKFSPSEILKDLQDESLDSITSTLPTSSSIIRILRLVLPLTHPRKSINEIAFDVGIPLPHVMSAVSCRHVR